MFWDIRKHTEIMSAFTQTLEDDIANLCFNTSDSLNFKSQGQSNKLAVSTYEGLFAVFNLKESDEEESLESLVDFQQTTRTLK